MLSKDKKHSQKECKKMSVPDECNEYDSECMINKSGKCQKKPIHVKEPRSNTPSLVKSIKSKKISPVKREQLTEKRHVRNRRLMRMYRRRCRLCQLCRL